MKRFFLIILLSVFSLQIYSQELNCSVQVYAPQVQGSDRSVYETLQKGLYEFMNQTKWTNYSYTFEERIECSILITISDRIATDEFKGTIQIQSRRPVYRTSYNSVMLNYIDKDFQFKYLESQPIEFQLNTFSSNLTAVLAYYAYIIIGLDFDSFSMNGGDPFYDNAQTIVNNAQNTAFKGWKAFESRKNRYWLVENLKNKTYSGIRTCMYKYHREGLDMMYDNLETGRSNIAQSLELVRQVNRQKPGLFVTSLFVTSKADEIVNIFSQASPAEKPRVVSLLKEIDPANASKYNKILENK